MKILDSSSNSFAKKAILGIVAAGVIVMGMQPSSPQDQANSAVGNAIDDIAEQVVEFDNIRNLVSDDEAMAIGLMDKSQFDQLMDDIKQVTTSTNTVTAEQAESDYDDAFHNKYHDRTIPQINIDNDTGKISISAETNWTHSKFTSDFKTDDADQNRLRNQWALNKEILHHFDSDSVESKYKEKYGRTIGAEVRYDDLAGLLKSVGADAFAEKGVSSEYLQFSEMSNNDFVHEMDNKDSSLYEILTPYVLENTDKVLEQNNDLQTKLIQDRFKEFGSQIESVYNNFNDKINQIQLSTQIDGEYFTQDQIGEALQVSLDNLSADGVDNLEYSPSLQDSFNEKVLEASSVSEELIKDTGIRATL